MDADTLSGLAAIVLSLAFAYLPGIKDWYDKLASTQKASVMALCLLVLSVAIFAASCGQLIDVGVTCDKSGAVGLAQVFVIALIANQGAYALFVKPYKPQTVPA